jgi:hypothetical protein
MKHTISILTLFLFFTACEKDDVSDSSAKLLSKVTVDNKIHESFEYNEKGQLIKQNYFGMCTTNPQDEYTYTYRDNRLDNIKSVTRGLFSSHTSMCDPTKGVQFIQSFTYNNNGRISTITSTNSVVQFIYNQAGFIERKVITGGTNPQTYHYTYDSRGNVIKEIDPQGNIQQYEYDSKINPLYRNKIHAGVSTPYTMSPNNVIKGTGTSGSFVRKFQYNLFGLPSSVLEDNGLTYVYTYE